MLHNFSNHSVQRGLLRLWETPNKKAKAPSETVLGSGILRAGVLLEGPCLQEGKPSGEDNSTKVPTERK